MGFQELIEGETPVLVDFTASWCGPCQMMAPVLQEVATETEGQAKIIKVDVDKNQQAAAAYRIQGVPTFILFKKGKNLWRHSGMVGKAELVKLLKEAAAQEA